MDTRAVTSSDRPNAPLGSAGPPPAHEALPDSPPSPEWSEDDGLLFPAESDAGRARSVTPPKHVRPASSRWPIAAGLAVVALLVVVAWRWWPGRTAAPADTGTVAIETSPPGASVLVDGRERGNTPLTLPLPPGAHRLTVAGKTGRRDLTLNVAAGTQVVHHVELTDAPPTTGRLQVPGPAGAPIAVDGTRRGVAPAELSEVPAGEHTVTVGEGAAAVTQRVTVPAGGVASLLVPVAQPGGEAPAWVSVVTPIEVQVFDGEVLIGDSTASRILVLAGRHTLNLVNADLKYRAARTVEVQPGRVVTVRIEPPNGVLSVNAVPWAEVLVDGKRVGETPIANLAVPIGAHEVILRNPKFPEQKRSVVISLGSPTRVGVDLRQ
jgi:eukaryotic-like serine/threonine-protein kinase